MELSAPLHMRKTSRLPEPTFIVESNHHGHHFAGRVEGKREQLLDLDFQVKGLDDHLPGVGPGEEELETVLRCQQKRDFVWRRAAISQIFGKFEDLLRLIELINERRFEQGLAFLELAYFERRDVLLCFDVYLICIVRIFV